MVAGLSRARPVTKRPHFQLVLRLLVTLLAVAFFWIVAALLFPFALLIWLVTLPFDRTGRILHLFTCAWSSIYLYSFLGWKKSITGRGKLPGTGPAVIVANHQSYLDALVLFATFRPFKPVSKASVRWLPLIGWNMVLNRYIRLLRGERRSVAEMSKSCRYWLRRGVPVMIYPEGTRSADGQIQEFKKGAFALAVEENCPICPVVIDGTASALGKKDRLLRLRARIRARVLDPIAPDEGDPKHPRDQAVALRDRVRARMIEALAEMRAQ